MNDYPKSPSFQGAPPRAQDAKYSHKKRAFTDSINTMDSIRPPNTTRFGEAVPTSFSWISPDVQRKRAAELEDAGKPKR
ncbi:MAG: hypothetical protein LBL34_03025 [Clostridiales bacterium]|jgi:hypothetical protein|nr:hypothetical protein [Clostridiales bacterium]